MKNKILVSSVAAVAVLGLMAGCGSSSSSSGTSGSSTLIPADDYIYNATATCTSGTGTVGDDNITITVNSSTPGTCTVSNGYFKLSDSNYTLAGADLKVIVPTGVETVYATPITTLVAEAVSAGLAQATAEANVKAMFGGLSDLNVDTTALSTTNKSMVTAVFTMLDQLKGAGASSTSLTQIVKAIVNTTPTTLSALTDGLSTAITTAGVTDVNTTIVDTIETLALNVGNATAAGNGLAALVAAAEMKVAVKAGTVTASDANTTFATKANAAATLANSALEGNPMLTTATHDTSTGLASATTGNITINLDANGTSTDVVNADLAVKFVNYSNANLTMTALLKDLNVTYSSGDLSLATTRTNVNASVAGSNYLGVETSTTTTDANSTLLGAVAFADGNNTINLSTIEGILGAALGYNYNASVASSYNLSNDWNVSAVVSLKDANKKVVTVTTADVNRTEAVKGSISYSTTLGKALDGYRVFKGVFAD